MPKYFYLSLLSLTFLPLVASAQKWDVPVTNDGYAYASIFVGNFSLLLSVVIGIIATLWVFRAAKKMGGGLFGSILNYVGIGMALVVVGTISVIFGDWLPTLWPNIINTVCFALGYIFMVIGANKLLKGIMST